EGIISKKADARYVQSRSNTWVKVKRVDIDSFVVIGFMSNLPKTTSSLLIADERDGELSYVGRVGSGIGEARARELYAQLAQADRDPPVTAVPKTPGAHGVEPSFTAEVGYRTRSAQNAPRAPVLLSFAPRKRAKPVKSLKAKLVSDRD